MCTLDVRSCTTSRNGRCRIYSIADDIDHDLSAIDYLDRDLSTVDDLDHYLPAVDDLDHDMSVVDDHVRCRSSRS